MTINTVRKPICFLFLSLLFFISCNGQVKTDLQNSNNSIQKNNDGPKIIKTQGSDEYQNISCGLQDKVGNLWFGTSGEGVYRYDGKVFTQFTIQNGLSSNAVRSIFEDKKGTIWFGTSKGLCFYDGINIKQISIPLNDNSSRAGSNEVFSIMQDKNEILWFGTADGIVCYNGNNFTRIFDNQAIINNSSLTLKSVQCMFEDIKGNIWFGSGPMAFEGLCFYDGKSLTNFKPQNQVWVRNITDDKNKRLLITTRGAGVMRYDGTNFYTIPKPMELRNDLLTYFLTDSKGNSWFASDYMNDNDITTGGLWSSDGKSFTEFTKEKGSKNTSVTFILEDRNGNLWVGTRNDGLYRYDGKNFTSFSE